MSAGAVASNAGSIELIARRNGSRTILERIRYDGISRCSRAFPHADAALIVLSQLGPGVVRGDHVTLTGQLLAGSHLIVTSQAATRLMGGGTRGSDATIRWTLDSGALLELVGEPLIATAEAAYETSTTIELAHGARVVLSEITRVTPRARVTLRTSVRQAGREVLYDAVNAAAAPATVGTFAALGIAATAVTHLAAELEIAADARSDVRIGIGLLPQGVFARVLSDEAWPVRSALRAMHDSVRSLLLGVADNRAEDRCAGAAI